MYPGLWNAWKPNSDHDLHTSRMSLLCSGAREQRRGIVSARLACNYGTLTSHESSSDSLLMDSAPAPSQTPVGPRKERDSLPGPFICKSLFHYSCCAYILSRLGHPLSTRHTCRHMHTQSLIFWAVQHEKWMKEQLYFVFKCDATIGMWVRSEWDTLIITH